MVTRPDSAITIDECLTALALAGIGFVTERTRLDPPLYTVHAGPDTYQAATLVDALRQAVQGAQRP